MSEPTVWGTAILTRRQPILSQPWNSLPCKKSRVHHRVHKFPNLDRTLNHTNQANIVINCSFEIRFHMHLPTSLRPSNQFLSSIFSELKFSSLPLVLHVPLIPLTTLIMTSGTAGGGSYVAPRAAESKRHQAGPQNEYFKWEHWLSAVNKFQFNENTRKFIKYLWLV